VGTYPLQAIIDCLITSEEEMILVDSLKEHTIELSFVRKKSYF
jgi:hypothetical protein